MIEGPELDTLILRTQTTPVAQIDIYPSAHLAASLRTCGIGSTTHLPHRETTAQDLARGIIHQGDRGQAWPTTF